jgi:hypothetical protein
MNNTLIYGKRKWQTLSTRCPNQYATRDFN